MTEGYTQSTAFILMNAVLLSGRRHPAKWLNVLHFKNVVVLLLIIVLSY
jgi:transcriptional regulator GlxA family with amidase domain